MKIEWTPWWNVAMHHRLEVLGVVLSMLSLTALGPICGITILYFLVKFAFLSLLTFHDTKVFNIIIFAFVEKKMNTIELEFCSALEIFTRKLCAERI